MQIGLVLSWCIVRDISCLIALSVSKRSGLVFRRKDKMIKSMFMLFFYLDPIPNHDVVMSWCMHHIKHRFARPFFITGPIVYFPCPFPYVFVPGRALLSECFTFLPQKKYGACIIKSQQYGLEKECFHRFNLIFMSMQ